MELRRRLFPESPYEGFSTAGVQLDLHGWHSTDPVFERLIAEVRPQLIIEVGTWKGASAIRMAEIVKQHGLAAEILCVDTWLGALEFWTEHDDPTRFGSLKLRNGFPSVYYTFLANVVLSGHADVITPFPQTSITGARWLNRQSVQADLIYIDGSHEEADVFADLAAYWPALRPGGVMFGDDFSQDAWPSVVRAVRAFSQQRGLSLDEDDEFWILRKPVLETLGAAPVRDAHGANRPQLFVHGTGGSEEKLAGLIGALGYCVGNSALFFDVTVPDYAAAVKSARSSSPDAHSVFWLENHSGTAAANWCSAWREALGLSGGAERVIALHPHQTLSQQRDKWEMLCRRIGADLARVRLDDRLLPHHARPIRPNPDDPGFTAILEAFSSLGIGPHDFYSFEQMRRLAAGGSNSRLEKSDGGHLECYSPSHFMLHPPAPGSEWTRLHLRGVDWSGARYMSTTLSLPNAKAPKVRFQWNIISPQGQRLHCSETLLNPRETKQWLVRLPEGVPPRSGVVLATQVIDSTSNAYAWATWRDPIIFS